MIFVDASTLLALLAHRDDRVGRAAVADLLRRFPQGKAFGYPGRGATQRQRAIERWRALVSAPRD